jgi:hypothetical protein
MAMVKREDAKDRKLDRRAKALRENLQRRKAQLRGRARLSEKDCAPRGGPSRDV